MCQFFSFVTKGDGNPLFFDAETRKRITNEGNQRELRFDSHASICEFFGLDEDTVNKYEYNPFTKDFEIDSMPCRSDADPAEYWARNYSFDEILATGCYTIDNIRDLPNDFLLPEILYGDLIADQVGNWVKTHKFPRIVKGYVRLIGLDLTDIVLPEEVDTLTISDSTIQGITLPKKIYKLSAMRCSFTEGTVLPESVKHVDVEGASIPGMIFPKFLVHLDLWKTEGIETATLPKRVSSLRTYGGGSYGISFIQLL